MEQELEPGASLESMLEVQRYKLQQADHVNTELNAKILDLKRERATLMKIIAEQNLELKELRPAESEEASE